MGPFKPVFTPIFLEDHQYWINNRPKNAEKVDALVKDIMSHPFTGIGKPEPLRWGMFKGCWSRRITGEHRIAYRVDQHTIQFLTCRYHY